MIKNKKYFLITFFSCLSLLGVAQQKLQVVIAGLSHDHVNRMLEKSKKGEIIIVGVTEANQQLWTEKQAAYQLPDSIFYSSLTAALKKTHPDLVMAYNAPAGHLAIVQTCMPFHIPVMLEKPLCFSTAEAAKIEKLSKRFNTKVFTNFPSAWYPSFHGLVKKANEIGPVTKMAMHGGHRGPIEIGCSKNFVSWLTDSIKNGGGAIIDFGCYGASIMTEIMKGKKPISVYAVARHLKPGLYPKVDDDATIVLEYPGTTGIIQASWGWPYTIMEAEVYGKDMYLHATELKANDPATLHSRNEKELKEEIIPVMQYKDEVEYLTAVIKSGATDNNTLLSLQRNVIVVQVLDAAKRSVKEGKKIIL